MRRSWRPAHEFHSLNAHITPGAALLQAQVCCLSMGEIAGSNSSGGIDVCLFYVFCVFRYNSLRRADHSSRGVLLSVCVSLNVTWCSNTPYTYSE